MNRKFAPTRASHITTDRPLGIHPSVQALRLGSTVTGNSTAFSNGTDNNSTATSSLSEGGNATTAAEETYVMWMGAGESKNGTFGLSAVATSGYPDGPFSLRRTLYPDGNETHDQTVFVGKPRLFVYACGGRGRVYFFLRLLRSATVGLYV